MLVTVRLGRVGLNLELSLVNIFAVRLWKSLGKGELLAKVVIHLEDVLVCLEEEKFSLVYFFILFAVLFDSEVD